MADALPSCLLNGELIATRDARVSPLDRAFLFGDAIYEVVPCYNGRPLRLDAHLDRLANSLEGLGMADPYPRSRWHELFGQLVEANGGGNVGVYLEVTRGAGKGRDFLPPDGLEPTIFGFAWPLAPPAQEQLENGLRGVVLEDIRWLRCDIKSTALLAAVLLRREAEARGGEEAILVRDGHLTEGSSSAVFLVKKDEIITPPASTERLPSITRQIVGDVLDELGLAATEREVPVTELMEMDEAWISSATREALAITHLGDRPIGTGKPGPVWKRVYEGFQALKARECGA